MAYTAIPAATGGGGGGVTSAVAGTGISVSGATGAVTFTNTAPFGADTTIQINNSAASPVSAWEGISTLTTNTAGAEVSKYVVKLLTAGAQTTAQDIRPAQTIFPNGATAAPGVALVGGGGMWYGAAQGLGGSNTVEIGPGIRTLVAQSDGSVLMIGAGNPTLYIGTSFTTSIGSSAGTLLLSSATGIKLANITTGFFGSTGTSKPTVAGSKGANAALASLLTALSGLGLLTDSST